MTAAALGAALTVCVTPAELGAQRRDVGAMADSVFARWNSTRSPGCAVGIAQNGQTLLTRGYGMANLETGTPLTGETILESGSVAKQFTATAVILLAMDGKLNLSDDIRKYFPEMPQYDRVITIRHLLTHTSGLREWSNLVAAAGWPRGQRAHTQDDLLEIAFRQKALNYPVGDHYSYTNTGYAIAKTLVERVSGQSFEQFSQERIFKPLGMTNTQWRDDFTEIVPGRAQAYSWQGNTWRLDMPFESVVGPGGMLTTVGDWLKWNEALAKSSLRPGHTDSLTRRMRLTNGREITYALGVVVSEYRGVPEVGHSGSTGGYSTYLVRYPDRGNLSIAVLCNSAQGAAGQYAHQIADRLITDFPVRVAQASVDSVRLDTAKLSKFQGNYRSRTGSVTTFSFGSTPGLIALRDGSYLMRTTRHVFTETSNGARRMLTITPDNDTLTFEYVGWLWSPSRQQLQEFEGRYRSDEIGATYTVKLEGDSLMMSVRPGVSQRLRHMYRDGFVRGAGGSGVWFSRDRDGKVTTMHFGEGRMWNLVLQRVR
jgi:CubicO group peptidase (beta-lactamase class C family)